MDIETFWMGDVDTIDINGYTFLPGNTSLKVVVNDAIANIGALTSMVQLACCDSMGNALTFAATGSPIFTPSLDQFGTLAASALSGATTLICYAASSFIPGDFIFINKNSGNQEISQFQTATGNTMTFNTAFNFTHGPDETLFACARQFKAKETTPVGFTGGTAQNYINLYLECDAIQYKRF